MTKPARGQSTGGVPLRRRSLQLIPTSANEETLTVGMIVATEAPAPQWIPDPSQTGDFDFRNYIKAIEILSMDGVDYSRAPGMPFVDSHDTHSTIDRVLGSVLNLRVEGSTLVADAKFRQRYAELVKDIKDGHLQQVSVGYEVYEYEIVGTDEKSGLPIVKAVRWCPHEVSSVAVGADMYAVMRSQNEQLFAAPVFKGSVRSIRSKERNMEEIETLVVAAEEAFAAADEALAALAEVSDEGASDEVKGRLAKLRARAEEDEPANTDTPAESESDTEEDKKAEEAARSIAKKRGKETEAFFNSLVGLKRGKELKTLLGDFIAARAIAQVSAPAANVVPVVDQPSASQRSTDIAKDLDPAALLARRKRGFVATK